MTTRYFSQNPILSRAFRCSIFAYAILRLSTGMIVLYGCWTLPAPIPLNIPYSASTLSQLENQSTLSRYLLAPWYRFDTVHYLEIAQNGYLSNDQNSVWPPLYPLLIRLLSPIVSQPMIAAIIISNLSAMVAFFLLYLTVAELFSESVAWRSLFWLSVFPTSFYLIAPYTESLFIALTVGTLMACRRRKWFFACLLGALATLTRIQGIFLALPILYEWVFAYQRENPFDWKGGFRNLASFSLLPIALGGFSIYVHFGLGMAWPWSSLGSGWDQHIGWPWEGILANVTLLLRGGSHYFMSLFYDLGIALLTIGLFIWGWKKLPVSFLIYSGLMFFSAIMKVSNDSSLVSVSRYALTIFPVFILLGLAISRNRWQMLWFALAIISQAVLTYFFYAWAWVA